MPLFDASKTDTRTGVSAAGGATGAAAMFFPGGLRHKKCYAYIRASRVVTTAATGTLTFQVYDSADGSTYNALSGASKATGTIAIGTTQPAFLPLVIPFTPINDNPYFKVGLSTITGLSLTAVDFKADIVFDEP